ncbi:hypothetical protein OpiT1DRAFT_03130 [Opitutaceae bacterium TAV1]|nr:hypothetical protein OpiT1DRAFT_03130 [Opitutaceae bacterium TAV1]
MEASTSGRKDVYTYTPNTADARFSGVTFTNKSASANPPTGTSGHATTTGGLIYGNNGMGFGITEVDTYLADHWIGNGFLNTDGITTAPAIETRDVQNHSWVSGPETTAEEARAVLSRLDYAIQRDDFVAVVGVNNGKNNDRPLLSAAYNVISVGRSDGAHSSTPTADGVQRPHIVVPVGTTSDATAVVSAAAALLIGAARDAGAGFADGDKSETVKALLLAGATTLPGWSRQSETSPLDPVQGAGQLNIFNSYHILAAGQQSGATLPEGAAVASTGWDYAGISSGETISYRFNLDAQKNMTVALTWNAIWSGSNYDDLTLSLANLDLWLYEVGVDGSLSLVQQSLSTEENLEFIRVNGLAAGEYLIQVSLLSEGDIEYALAWQASVPEPATVFFVLAGIAVLVIGRIAGLPTGRRQG